LFTSPIFSSLWYVLKNIYIMFISYLLKTKRFLCGNIVIKDFFVLNENKSNLFKTFLFTQHTWLTAYRFWQFVWLIPWPLFHDQGGVPWPRWAYMAYMWSNWFIKYVRYLLQGKHIFHFLERKLYNMWLTLNCINHMQSSTAYFYPRLAKTSPRIAKPSTCS
jgi:hypothetical protein